MPAVWWREGEDTRGSEVEAVADTTEPMSSGGIVSIGWASVAAGPPPVSPSIVVPAATGAARGAGECGPRPHWRMYSARIVHSPGLPGIWKP